MIVPGTTLVGRIAALIVVCAVAVFPNIIYRTYWGEVRLDEHSY